MTRILDMFGGILNDALKSFLYIICSPKLSFVATTKPELLEVTMDTFRGLLTPKAKTSLHCLILVLEVEELGNMHKKCQGPTRWLGYMQIVVGGGALICS